MANFIASLFGGGNKGSAYPTLAPFYTDPHYTAEQDFLQPYGMGLMTGNNIPDFYKSLATQNSPEFQSVLAQSNRNIGQAATEAAARSGTGRGGNLPGVTAQAIADNTGQLSYQDFLNSNAGKQFLLTKGNDISSGVRSAGQVNAAAQNDYSLNQFNAQLGALNYGNQAAAAKGAALGSAIPMATTIAGGIGGFFLGGPQGAVTGAGLGKTLGGGLTGNTDNIASLFSSIPGASKSSASTEGGVSSIGGISKMSTDDLMKYFNLN